MQVVFKKVLKILNECARGYELRRHPHFIAVSYNGKTAYLPKGGHGRKGDHEIEVGYVRRMARALGILECAKVYVRFG